MIANGSWRLCSTFSQALSVSIALVLSPIRSVTASAGPRAMIRVTKTRFHFGICKRKKPSITNCPAYVPVMVLLCPAAFTMKNKQIAPSATTRDRETFR